MENTNIVNAIIKLQILNAIKKSNLNLQFLSTKISFYERQLNLLKQNKPFDFQKRKLKDYYKRITEYENKLKESYNQIVKEMNMIFDLNQIIIE